MSVLDMLAQSSENPCLLWGRWGIAPFYCVNLQVVLCRFSMVNSYGGWILMWWHMTHADCWSCWSKSNPGISLQQEWLEESDQKAQKLSSAAKKMIRLILSLEQRRHLPDMRSSVQYLHLLHPDAPDNKLAESMPYASVLLAGTFPLKLLLFVGIPLWLMLFVDCPIRVIVRIQTFRINFGLLFQTKGWGLLLIL